MRLDLVVGPNGAGKTTFTELILTPSLPGHAFVNADTIAAGRWPEDPQAHSYEAAEIAARTREELITTRTPFITETVFSHPSKLDLISSALAADYTVVLHVLIIPEDLAVERVRHRVAAGGHDVPEHKIRERFHRLFDLLVPAIDQATSADVWDNSNFDGPVEVARFSLGHSVGAPHWPNWTPTPLTTITDDT